MKRRVKTAVLAVGILGYALFLAGVWVTGSVIRRNIRGSGSNKNP